MSSPGDLWWGEDLSLLIHPTSQNGRPWDREWQPAEHSHHGDCIIEQGLAKDDDKESLVDMHLLKDSQHSHGVHC